MCDVGVMYKDGVMRAFLIAAGLVWIVGSITATHVWIIRTTTPDEEIAS
jgi:hypothetical protein